LKEVVYKRICTPLRLLALEHEDRLAVSEVDREPLESGPLRVERRLAGGKPLCL
jgi:hypothetical protein